MKIIGREQNRTDDAYIQRIKLDQSLVMDDIIERFKHLDKEIERKILGRNSLR